MSKYGRLYEDASNARRELQAALPGLTGNFTPEDVRTKLRQMNAKIGHLLARWEGIEDAMKREDD